MVPAVIPVNTAAPAEDIVATEPTCKAPTVAAPDPVVRVANEALPELSTVADDGMLMDVKDAIPPALMVAADPTCSAPTVAPVVHVNEFTAARPLEVMDATLMAENVAFPRAVITPPLPKVVVPDTSNALLQVIE